MARRADFPGRRLGFQHEPTVSSRGCAQSGESIVIRCNLADARAIRTIVIDIIIAATWAAVICMAFGDGAT